MYKFGWLRNVHLMAIGNSKCPRSFRKETGQDLGFDYHGNKTAWMNTELFFAWLRRFDEYIGKSPDERLFFSLKTAKLIGKIDTLPELKNVEVRFLSPKATSKMQPMEAGIIAAIKRRYRRKQLLNAFDVLDCNVPDDRLYDGSQQL